MEKPSLKQMKNAIERSNKKKKNDDFLPIKIKDGMDWTPISQDRIGTVFVKKKNSIIYVYTRRKHSDSFSEYSIEDFKDWRSGTYLDDLHRFKIEGETFQEKEDSYGKKLEQSIT